MNPKEQLEKNFPIPIFLMIAVIVIGIIVIAIRMG